MIGKGVSKEKSATLAEVLEILEKQKKMGELEYGQRLTYDYAQKFAKLDAKKARELMGELLKLGNIREQRIRGRGPGRGLDQKGYLQARTSYGGALI